ncbi:ABC transporter ATP-binding protein [Caloranaerobacter azorensis]|uniref:ABC transporter ATP-binding protein n=1 Tax=Caloranaerobacter azorensis TaxID=116090 RepID=UPI00054D6F7A|nr:ABC transporter ATP-binding protein [Caloranaerobacter azorensis]
MGELIIENLKVKYDKNIILNNFNLIIKKGELVVILGPSGCGKSTLLYAISGLVKPFAGNIIYGDKYLFSKEKNINIKVEDRHIGFVFQDYALWPHMTVYKNIAYPLKNKKLSKKEISEKVDEVLNMVNLKDKKTSYPGELSGGEKQRVALARAIVMNPSIILLDEPLANIDANLKMQLMVQMKNIQKSLCSTMIYVTHDQNEAFEMADRIVIMREGLVIQEGTPEEIYMKPKNAFVANFVGISNLVEPKKFSCKCDSPNKYICVRPEDIKITRNGKYCGIVKRNKFKGQRSECIVSYNDMELIIYNNNDSKISEGEEIRFDIEKYHVIENQ